MIPKRLGAGGEAKETGEKVPLNEGVAGLTVVTIVSLIITDQAKEVPHDFGARVVVGGRSGAYLAEHLVVLAGDVGRAQKELLSVEDTREKLARLSVSHLR